MLEVATIVTRINARLGFFRRNTCSSATDRWIMRTSTFLLAVLLIVLASGVRADEHDDATLKLSSVNDIEWKDGPSSLPPGAKIAVLEGDPNKEGPFVFRVKVPDGYHIPPHTHPKTERVTVISGTFNIGMGETFDEKATKPMPAGTYGYSYE